MKITSWLLSYIPGSWKNMIFWKIETAAYLRSRSWLKPRSHGDYQMAKDFYLNYHALPEERKRKLLSGLVSGLDSESQVLVKTILDREKYVMTHDLLPQKRLFAADELKGQKEYYHQIGRLKRYFWHQDFSAFSPESFVFLSGLVYLPKEVQDRLRGGLIIDGGAFNGDSALNFVRVYDARVIAFEPEPGNFQQLQRNISRTGSIKAVNKGLGNGQEKQALISNYGASSQIGSGKDAMTALELVALDDYLKENKTEKVTAIKLDLEGYEKQALAGMTETIKNFRPLLAISIYHNAQDFFTIKSDIEALGLGYRFKIVKANPFSLIQEVSLLAY